MDKIKWVRAEFGVSLNALAEKMKKVPFDASEEEAEGFRIQERGSGFLYGQFIQKQTFIDQIFLPTGDAYEERRSDISIAEFRLSAKDELNLELVNPPRRIQPFFNALAELTAQEFSYRSTDVNVLAWIDEIERRLGAVSVLSMDCNGVQLSSTVIGRFAFKGTSDVRAEYAKTLRRRSCVIESARCEVRSNEGTSGFELFRTGAVKGRRLSDGGVRDQMRKALTTAMATD
jgi:hypothetical protein